MTEIQREEVAKTFGMKLRELRKNRGMQQHDVAEKLGIRPSAICNWEKGLAYPTFLTMIDLCSVFEIDSSYFFGSEEENASSISLREVKHQDLWRQLMDYEKETVNRFMEMMIDNRKQQFLAACRENFRKLPLSSLKVCAGSGNYLDDNGDADEYLYLRRCKSVNEADEVITVTGKSMEPTFRNGDLLLVRHQESIQEGQIGVFLVNGEGMVKEYREDGLWPHNPDFSPVVPDSMQDVRCFGIVLDKVTDTMLADDKENSLLSEENDERRAETALQTKGK